MKPLRIAALMVLFSFYISTGAYAQALKVAEVLVKGNVKVPSDTVQSILRTKVGTDFSETIMNSDLDRIRRLGFFYEDSVSAAHDPTADGERVTFTVEEHPAIQQILITGNTVLAEPKIRAVLTSKVGEVMNSETVAKDVEAIFNIYRQEGYQAVVGVTDPEQMISRDGTLTIPIIEVTVERIDITGNRKTKTNVIRRELRTKPGQPFNIKKLQRDLERIYNLDLFEEVGPPEFDVADPNKPGKVVIKLPIKEKKTGQISLGLGYSSPQGVVGRIELAETNFRGRGEGINSLFELGGRAGKTSYEFGYFWPYLDHHHTSLSASVYNKVIYRFANSTIVGPSISNSDNIFDEIRQGAQVTLTRPLTDTTRAVIGLRSENVHLNLSAEDINNPTLPQFVRQEGRISVLNLRHIRDTRDILTDPAKGVYYTSDVDFGQSDVQPNVKGGFTRGSLDLRRYFSKGARKTPTERKTVIAGRLMLGTMGGKIPFSEQFFIGGAENLRGYLESRFWGKNMALLNLEYRKPFAKQFQGVAFIDIGDAWGTNYELPVTADPNLRFKQHNGFSPHVGYGVGIRIVTPIGPLRLDYGIGSEGSRAHFSIGHVF